MGDLILIGKLVIGIVCVAVSILLLRHPKPFAFSNRGFNLFSLLLLVVSRGGLFIGLFFVLGLLAEQLSAIRRVRQD